MGKILKWGLVPLLIGSFGYILNGWIDYKMEKMIEASNRRAQESLKRLDSIIKQSVDIPVLVIKIENDLNEIAMALNIKKANYLDTVEEKYINTKENKEYYQLIVNLSAKIRIIYYPDKNDSDRMVFNLKKLTYSKYAFPDIEDILRKLEDMRNNKKIDLSKEINNATFALLDLEDNIKSLKNYFSLREEL